MGSTQQRRTTQCVDNDVPREPVIKLIVQAVSFVGYLDPGLGSTKSIDGEMFSMTVAHSCGQRIRTLNSMSRQLILVKCSRHTWKYYSRIGWNYSSCCSWGAVAIEACRPDGRQFVYAPEIFCGPFSCVRSARIIPSTNNDIEQAY